MQFEPTLRPAPRGTRRLACAAALAGAVALGPAGPAAAEPAIACGSSYTVAKGDTLFSIAALAYGNGEHFWVLFAVNQDILSNIDRIEVGNRLQVPCLDGNEVGSRPVVMPVARSVTLQAPTASLAAAAGRGQTGVWAAALPEVPEPARGDAPKATGSIAPSEPEAAPAMRLAAVAPAATAEGPAPEAPARGAPAFAASINVSTDHEVVFLAGSVAPYADESLPGGGVLTELIVQALRTAVPDWPYRLGFLGDRSPYLPAPHRGASFDIGFPALRPDCAQRALPSAREQQACDSYLFSRPILLAEMAYYGRSGDTVLRATSAAVLAGLRFCSAEQPLDPGPSQAGPAAPFNPETPAPAPERCLRQLAAGETDVVMGLKSDSDATIRRLGLSGAVAEIEGLRSTRTLHAFAPRDNAYAIEVLKALDRGIGDLMLSGRWFEIVSGHQTGRFAVLAR